MNYASRDIQQGIGYNAASSLDSANQSVSKRIKDAAIMMEYVKKRYDSAQQDIHFIDTQSNKTDLLENSFQKTKQFFSTDSSLVSNLKDVEQLAQAHQTVSEQVLLTYQAALKSEDLNPNFSNFENISEHVSNVSSQLADHVTQLQSRLDQSTVLSNSVPGQSPKGSIDLSKIDLISAIVLMTSDSYEMATALSSLQARFSDSLNKLLGSLNDLQALVTKFNSFYGNAQTYIVQHGSDKSQPAPSPISWGGTYNGVTWSSLVAGVSGTLNGGVIVPSDNSLAKMFGHTVNGQIIMDPGAVANAIKYVSQQMSGMSPGDSETPNGTFFAQHGTDPFDSSNTTFLLQAIGKTTETLQGKLSAVANVVQLAQQTVAQVTNIFSAIMNLWSGLISKL